MFVLSSFSLSSSPSLSLTLPLSVPLNRSETDVCSAILLSHHPLSICQRLRAQPATQTHTHTQKFCLSSTHSLIEQFKHCRQAERQTSIGKCNVLKHTCMHTLIFKG